MACGLPVISTRCGGPEDYIRNGENGYLVLYNDPAAMAAAMLRLLNDPDQRREMGRQARAFVCMSYSRAVIERHLRAAFERVYPGIVNGDENL
jgi:glycosyltransferase involved in cell wall biosynthesis